MKPFPVSQITEYISRVINTDPLLSEISVIGEISNLNYHYSGHVYFSLVDNNSVLKCFLPKSIADKLDYKLSDGMEVIINGGINVFKKGGYYSLFVNSIIKSKEIGSLSIEFEKLKEKLNNEGLFSPIHKKELPFFPKNIAIVTSITGAAVEDIKRIITNKNNYVNLHIFNVQVQGLGASQDISNAIYMINKDFPFMDLMIVGRGGGSQEDLWAFNEENVARAIFNSNIPIISAVGHEIDVSITDFVADKCAPTPTAAAEIAVPDINKLKEQIENYKTNLLNDLKNKVSYEERHIIDIFNNIRIDITNKININITKLENLKNSLDDNNPRKVLEKGYSIPKNLDGNIIKSKKEFKVNTDYRLILKDGEVTFNILDK